MPLQLFAGQACERTYPLALSADDDQVAALWAVIATAFVFRTSQGENISAAKTRVTATALSFALCFAYLLFLPFHAWGMAALIALGTLVLISVGLPGDIGVGGITTAAVMVIAALSPHHPWQQPLIGAVGTTIGISIGLAASWIAIYPAPEQLAVAERDIRKRAPRLTGSCRHD